MRDTSQPAATREAPTNPWRRGPLVLALHGGESSDAPLVVTHKLAQRLERPIHIVTVVEYEAVHFGRVTLAAMPDWVVRDLGEPRREMMTHRMRQAFGTYEGWTLEVRYGSPAREIAEAAERVDGSLIVVDASPRRRLRRSVAGVRALQLVRHATCPVLSVAPGSDSLPGTIVASVDFGPASTWAVQTALLLARDGASLSLAHVPFPFTVERPLRDAKGGLIAGDVMGAFEQLLDVVRPYAPRDLVIETVELSGRTADAVLSHAESKHADLIATGAHGPGPVERFFVGSVATNLLHLAECSVLAAPAPHGSTAAGETGS